MPPQRTGANVTELGPGDRSAPSSSISSSAVASSSKVGAASTNLVQHGNATKRPWSSMSGHHEQRSYEDARHRSSSVHYTGDCWRPEHRRVSESSRSSTFRTEQGPARSHHPLQTSGRETAARAVSRQAPTPAHPSAASLNPATRTEPTPGPKPAFVRPSGSGPSSRSASEPASASGPSLAPRQDPMSAPVPVPSLGPAPAPGPVPTTSTSNDRPRPDALTPSNSKSDNKSSKSKAKTKGKGKAPATSKTQPKSKTKKKAPKQKDGANTQTQAAEDDPKLPKSDAKLVRLNAASKWHVLGRTSYGNTIREAGSILNVEPTRVKLVLRQPPAAECEIRPSAWPVIPIEAPVYAVIHKADKKADKAQSANVASQPIVSSQGAGSSAMHPTPTNADSGHAPMELTRSETRYVPLNHNDSRFAGLQNAWAASRVIRNATEAKMQLSFAYRHLAIIEHCKCQDPDQDAHLKLTRRIRKAEQWYKNQLVRFETDPHYVAHYSLAATGDEDDQQSVPGKERVPAEVGTFQMGRGLLGPSPVQVHRSQISTKRSRFANESRSDAGLSLAPGDGDERLRRRLAVVSISSGSSSPSTTSGTSCSSDTTSTSSSSLSASSSSSSSTANAPATSPQPPSRSHSARPPMVRKREFEEDEVEFELVSVHEPAQTSRRQLRQAHTPPRRRRPRQTDSETSHDELASSDEEDRSSRHTSITTCPTADEADDELGTASDWSEVSRLPRRSSGKKWTGKEQALFVSKLQQETANLTRRLTIEERTAFFCDFERKYRVLFSSRTASALATRLHNMKSTARESGKELPRQLMYLLGSRASASVGAGGGSTAAGAPARKRPRR
ncbi:hypothetical protein OC846_003810 [Tilletia horrida]|uniref:Uncharacterized protein n=1 Tax=Tilletia horrida TaxID=155126 RepID=A0AAN6GRT7_9BASI|nr:hypothetical protein OC846_003810 [Tilletia horrida]KAK0565134.1 hypothetical protein OC861_003931 [Tilletia horrida]